MATPVIMPRQGQSVESCILTEWKVNVGDQVAEGDVLAVIETDKASFDLESTASGSVLALFWEADDDVPVLANVAAIGNEGEDVEEFRPEGQGGASAPVAEAPTPAAADSTAPSAAARLPRLQLLLLYPRVGLLLQVPELAHGLDAWLINMGSIQSLCLAVAPKAG